MSQGFVKIVFSFFPFGRHCVITTIESKIMFRGNMLCFVAALDHLTILDILAFDTCIPRGSLVTT